MRQKTYAELSRNRPPSSDVVAAVEHVAQKERALDLGAGSLRNTRYLLEQGFRVDAIDRDPLMQEVADELQTANLHTQVADFMEFDFPVDAYDLVVAHNTLPFATPGTFPDLWSRVVASLRTGGIFCGTFFGPHDTWAHTKPDMSFVTKDDVEHLLSGLEILSFREHEEDATDIQGNPKHWHYFEATARKVY